jgi:acetyltransferase
LYQVFASSNLFETDQDTPGNRSLTTIVMSTYRLSQLFSPRSVAVVGASPRMASAGHAVLNNLRAASFPGKLHLVNPHYPEIDGLRSVDSVLDPAEAPDLIVIAVPAPEVPKVVAGAAEKGAAAAIIITAGLGHGPGSLADACVKAARPKGLRLIGPNCLGVLAPRAKLNASFAASMPQPGDLAWISQSGAIVAGMVEWANLRDVGFSAIASLGDMVDVDVSDLLDFFALDRATRAILLYVEAIPDARKFMSAARAAARTKPVVVVKSGRHAQGAKAAQTHTGALAGADAVYDAAFRRAGLLRVRDLEELFAAAETLGRLKPFFGRRLAILTNGGGIGVLVVDRLADLGGTLASLAPDTIRRLDAALPPRWSRSNPVDIVGDADAARYAAAFEILIEDAGSDAILVTNVPTALASATDAAQAIVVAAGKHASTVLRPKPVFAVWIGQDGTAERAFDSAGIPHFENESDAVGGFMHLVRYREAIDALMETPPSLPGGFFAGCRGRTPDRATGDRARTSLARPAGDCRATESLLHPDQPRTPGAQSRGGRASGRSAARGWRHRRGEDSVTRHRAQVRRRRSSAQPDQRDGCPRSGCRCPGAEAQLEAAGADHGSNAPSDDHSAEGARADCRLG